MGGIVPELWVRWLRGQRGLLVFAILLPALVWLGIYRLAFWVPIFLARSNWGAELTRPWFVLDLIGNSIILVCSLVLSIWLTKGRLSQFGFQMGSFRLTPRFFLWVLPTAILVTLQVVGAAGHSPRAPKPPTSVIPTAWIYSSVCDAIFMQGLIQSWLSPVGRYRLHLFRRCSLSAPVLLSALLSAVGLLFAWPTWGVEDLGLVSLAFMEGAVAGYYREKTGSIVPAGLVYALFVAGGTIPLWLLPMGRHQMIIGVLLLHHLI